MAPKITLDIAPFPGICVVAICAPMRDYRLAWHLNNQMDCHFVQEFPLTWSNKKRKTNTDFAVFRCPDNNELALINNRNDNTVLMSSLATIDFFLVFEDAAETKEPDEWMAQLKKIPGVTLVQRLAEPYLSEWQVVLSELEFQAMQRRKDAKENKSNY